MPTSRALAPDPGVNAAMSPSLDIPKQRPQQWAAVLQFSEHMLTAARADEWERVVELDAQRSAIIQSFFQQPVSPAESAVVGDGIRRILEQDREIQQLGRERQRFLMSELDGLKKNKRAVAAYDANSG